MPIFKAFTQRVNQRLGAAINSLGYDIERSYRRKTCSIPLVEILGGMLLKCCDEVVTVQVGAFDGLTSSPISKLLSHSHSRAFLIEPQPAACSLLRERFKHNPRITIIEAAIAPMSGSALLYMPIGESHSQLSSLSPSHLPLRSLAANAIKVNALNAEDLVRQNGINCIDLLQIDAEGSDWSVLQQFLSLGFQPKVINLETFHLSKPDRLQLTEKLQAMAYLLVDHNLDTLAVSQSFLDQHL